MLNPGFPRTRRAAGCGGLTSPSSPKGAGTASARGGLFGAVEWKIDFNPLCGEEGARSALGKQGFRRSGGPLPRPGLESLQTHAARGPPRPPGVGKLSTDLRTRAAAGRL